MLLRMLIPPIFRNFDSVLVFAFLLSRHTQVGSVLDKLRHVVAVHCVKHVPEVLAVWQPTVGSWIWHIDHKVFDIMHEWPELLHREFLVPGYVDVFHFAQ